MSTWQALRSRRRYLRIGHRGAAALAPQNTLAGFERAIDLGVDAVEFDVRKTADGRLVVLHDAHLQASTNGEGLVAASTLQEIRSLDAGDGQMVPTLDDALDFLRGRALAVIDLKEAGYEEQVLSGVQRRHMDDDVLVCGLNAASLRAAGALAPDIWRAISYPEDRASASTKPYLAGVVSAALKVMRWSVPRRIGAMMRGADATGAMLYYKLISPELVQAVHAGGGWIGAWTVDDAGTIAALVAMGVDSITSNRPDLFAAVV
jgi:glycerophosphoryl diester phosphodiesterase